jgi:hypothetical protein
MNNFEIVKDLEAPYNLDKVVPDVLLRHVGALLLIRDDFVLEITTVSQLHNDAQRGSRIVDK